MANATSDLSFQLANSNFAKHPSFAKFILFEDGHWSSERDRTPSKKQSKL